MADWEDDDDFGGFESADIGNIGSVQDDVASPIGETVTTLQKETAQTDILDWILSNTSKAEAPGSPLSQAPNSLGGPAGGVPYTSPSTNDSTTEALEDSPSSISHGEQLKDRLNDSAEIAKSLDNIFSGSEVAITSESQQDTQSWSADFSKVQDTIRATAAEEPSIERLVDNKALHRLQAELEAAVLMKEQTEKSMKTLQEELEVLTEKRKEDLAESAKAHEEDLEKLKLQHKDEMEELQNTSEETVKIITRQYSDIWKMFEKEKSLELESNTNSVTDKCIDLLKQQQEMLSRKLEDGRIMQERELRNTLEKEKETMQNEFEVKMERAKENLEKELTEQLQEKMADEAKNLQELHTATLKEAMTNQQNHFAEVLQSTLEREREKFTETLKEAVKNAQNATEKAAEDRRKVQEKHTKSHMMTVKMFLSSALQQLDLKFPDGTTNNEIVEES